MAQACEENKGVILPRTEINCGHSYLALRKDYNPVDNKTLYICIKKYGAWLWAPFDQSSTKTMKDYKSEIYNTLQATFVSRKVTPYTLPIKISDASGSNASQINGTFYFVPEEEKGTATEKLPVYVCIKELPERNGRPQSQVRYLYIVKPPGRDPANPYRIWLGNQDSMNTNRHQGWLRSKFFMTLSEVQCPWTCPYWEIWDGTDQAGRWINSINVKVECAEPNKLLPENSIQIMELLKKEKEISGKTSKLNKKLNSKINILQDKSKAYTDMSCLLYNKMSKEDRQEFLKESPKFLEIFHKNDICVCCLGVGKKVKCLHFDCAGACKKCREEEDKIRDKANQDATASSCDEFCCACGKKQELQCPICFDHFRKDNMDIFKCGHGVCYGCCWKSVKVNKKIKKCPSCRHKI